MRHGSFAENTMYRSGDVLLRVFVVCVFHHNQGKKSEFELEDFSLSHQVRIYEYFLCTVACISSVETAY